MRSIMVLMNKINTRLIVIFMLLALSCLNPRYTCQGTAHSAGNKNKPSNPVDWPAIRSAIPKDPVTETKISDLIGTMSLDEKVGQMVQASLEDLSPEDIARYHIGAVLIGGGMYPHDNKDA